MRSDTRTFDSSPTEKEIERFWAKVDRPEDIDLCWHWNRTLTNGYGKFTYDGWHPYAHRFSYFLHWGNPSPEKELHHVCHEWDTECVDDASCIHRSCVNPTHLVEVTPGEHNHVTPNNVAYQNRLKEFCKRGHYFTSENTYVYPGTDKRECITCRRERDKARQPAKYEREKETWTHSSEMRDFAAAPKLSYKIAEEIRQKYATGSYSQRALARDYQVSQPLVGQIVRGERWGTAPTPSERSNDVASGLTG